MKQTIHTTRTLLSTAVALGCSSQLMAAEGGFIEGATATLQARNYYFSRDYSDIVGANRQSKAEAALLEDRTARWRAPTQLASAVFQ
jgi:hypothetical protein